MKQLMRTAISHFTQPGVAPTLTSRGKLFSTFAIALVAVACGDKTFAFTGTEYEMGVTQTKAQPIGYAKDQTCFLAGIRGNLLPPPGSPQEVEVGGGVRAVPEPVDTFTFAKYEMYVSAAGRPIAVNVRCVDSVAGRTQEKEWKSGNAKMLLAPVDPAHPMRRCFLTRITAACTQAAPDPCPGGFRDPTDWVYVWKDELGAWWLHGEVKQGHVTAHARCIDVSEDNGHWEWGCGGTTQCPPGGSARIPLAPDSQGRQCFLTHVRGSFDRDQPPWWDGVYITRPGGQYFYLNTTSGKDGGVTCVSLTIPVTGSYVAKLSGLDNLMVSWMNKYGFQAATLAVLKDKKLVYERGFGYQDKNLNGAILPNARMRLASNSIAITRRALRQLISDGLVNGNDLVFQVLNLQPWGGGTYADPRMQQITIQNLIDDKACIADQFPPNKTVGQLMGLGRNSTLAERLGYAWSQASMMEPNDCIVGKTPKGSHFAMEFAAQVIATRANPAPMNNNDPTIVGQRYGDYITSRVGQPIGADFFQARNLETEAFPKEIWYKSLFNADPEWNRNWASGQPQVSAAYAIDFFARPGSGTVVAAGRDVARFLNEYFLNGAPKPASLSGIVWGSTGYGSLPGTTSVIDDQVWPTGASRSFVLLVNMRDETITPDNIANSMNEITNSIRSYLDSVTMWPTIDLF
jgi:CubicO group peptidase (beta-lactamase class C family)